MGDPDWSHSRNMINWISSNVKRAPQGGTLAIFLKWSSENGFECKCQIFVEYTHYFTGIITAINTELSVQLPATAFVVHLCRGSIPSQRS